MGTSRWVQLTPYCLIEYIYADSINPENYSFDFLRIQNNSQGYIHIMNVDGADSVTRNVQERSAVQTGQGRYVDTDKDQIPTYLDYIATEKPKTQITAANCPYDEIRFNFQAGYNFEDLDGVMMQITADERAVSDIDGQPQKLVLANLVFLKTADYFEFNPKPVLLGDKVYDKFVRVRIPSIKLNNDIYYSLEGNPTQAQSFVAKITSNGMGFLRANPLKISMIEIASTEVLEVGSADYNQYNIGTTKTVSINQADEFALLGATVQPSQGGDYFEYFATWAGGFIEDYIGLTSGLPGYDYIVIHELRVLEQVGSLFTETAFFQSIQEENFDTPQLFRPIIHNAGTAVSFTIEYVMRLYNKADSQQLIRTASVTNFNPKQWGKNIAKIQLLNEPEPMRVYNKIVAGPSLPETTFLNNDLPVQIGAKGGGASGGTTVVKVSVPAFFNSTLITVQSDTMNLNAQGQLELQASSNTQPVYGQGDATIVLSPFDNYFKFTILKSESSSGNVPSPLDLGQNAEYFIVFMTNEGTKKRYPFIPDAKIGDPQQGDLVFKIPGSDAVNILEYTNRQFWIVSRFADTGNETGIYYGEFVTVDEMEEKRDRDKAAAERSKTQAAQDQRITDLENKLAAAEAALLEATQPAGSATDSSTAIDAAKTGNNITAEKIKIPAGLSQDTIEQIKVKVPGLNKGIPKSFKTSVVSNIKPKVIPKTFKKKSSE